MRFFLATAIMLLCAVTSVKAQDVATAILQHGDNVKTFNGVGALGQALEIAEDGDLISLSSGLFNGVKITKAVKIQGAGYSTAGFDQAKGDGTTTRIQGKFDIEISEEESNLHLEGLHLLNIIEVKGMLLDALVRNCRFSSRFQLVDQSKNCSFIECWISEFDIDENPVNLLIDHCVINNLYGDGPAGIAKINNCIIKELWNPGHQYTIRGAAISNCIITHKAGNGENTVWTNCIWTNDHGSSSFNPNPNASQTNLTFLNKDAINALFKPETFYELTDEAAKNYLGTDGTQIGIYGGTIPFSNVPTIPQIIKAEIPSETTADGKLPISITVESR